LFFERGYVFPRLAEDRHRRAQLHRVPLLDEKLEQRPLVLEREVHVGLVGLDLGDDVAGGHLVPFLLVPLGQNALLHGGRQLGKPDDRRHGYSR
jgi:hypothetical protein